MMSTVMRLREKDKLLAFDSGMELIWFLEDAYEQKDAGKFLSLVSIDFKKDFFQFRAQLEREFSESSQIHLYMLLLSKDQDFNTGIYSYDICWSKRVRKLKDDCCQREFGRARIVFKKYSIYQKETLMVHDICGDNPFVSV